jgi:peptidyl-prolyl cis-trans isomerase C
MTEISAKPPDIMGRMKFPTLLLLALLAPPADPQTPPAKPKPASPKPAGQAKPAASKAAAKREAPKPAAVKPAPAKAGSDRVVVTVGEESFTAAEIDRIIETLPPQVRQSVTGAGRRQFVENFARIKVLAQEGRRRKLDQTASFRAQLALQRDELLAQSTYNEIAEKVGIGEAQLRAYYDQHRSEFDRARARHILVRFKGSPVPLRAGQKELTEAEALAKVQEIQKRLQAGSDWNQIARAESDDAGSGLKGGDLGFFPRGQMVPEFEKVVFSLPIGKVSDPVKTTFGYHLIKVEARESKTFEQAKAEIEGKLRPETAQRLVEELQKRVTVVIDPQYAGEEKK